MLTDRTTSLIHKVPGAMIRSGSLSLGGSGQPSQRFRKDLIKVGKYTKASTGQDFEITPADLDAFAKTFASMKAAGVKVPLPVGHTNDPEANRGYAEDLYVDGDSLIGTLELVGEDAIKLAGRAEVSVCITPELIDGKGNKYTNAIEHIAIVTDPVVPDQGGWIKIAASREGNEKRASAMKLSQGASTMDWKELAGMLGIADAATMDDAALGAAIKAKVQALMTAGKTAASREAELTSQLNLARSASVPTVADDTLDALSENVSLKIDALHGDAKISKAVGEDLKAILCGDTANRQTRRVLLSRTAGKAAGLDEGKSLADRLIESLAKNDPKELGTKTRTQLALSRQTPDAGAKPETDEEAEKAAKARADRINAARGVK